MSSLLAPPRMCRQQSSAYEVSMLDAIGIILVGVALVLLSHKVTFGGV
jgi:hypothetical protein